MKEKKSSQNKYQFLFFWTLLLWKKKISTLYYPKPELLLPYLCLSFKKQKLSKLQRQKKIIPVKKLEN